MTISRPDIYALLFPEFIKKFFNDDIDKVCFIDLKDPRTEYGYGDFINKYYKNQIIIDDWCELKEVSNKNLFDDTDYNKHTKSRISLYKIINESSTAFIYNQHKIPSNLKSNNKDNIILYIENLISHNITSYNQNYDYLLFFFESLKDNQYLFFTILAKDKNYFNFCILPNIRKALKKTNLYLNAVLAESNAPFKNIDDRIYNGIRARENIIDQTNRHNRALELDRINTRYLFIISKNKTKGILYAEDIKQNHTKDKLYETNLINSYINKFEKLIKNKSEVNKIDDLVKFERDILREKLKNGITLKEFSHQQILIGKIQNQINFLEKDFKGFKSYKLKELCFDINYVGESSRLKELYNKKNVLFVEVTQNYDNFQTYDNLTDYKQLNAKIKTPSKKNLLALELNSEIIISEYLKLYFKSHLGQLKIDLIYIPMFPVVSKFNIDELSNIKIFVPDIKEQKNLITIFEKLESVSESVKKISENVFNFPISSERDLLLLDTIYRNTEELSDVDRVRSIMQRKKETPDTEYKLTFGYDPDTKQKATYLEHAAFKEIVSFLNERGGDLLIGVKDKNTEVVGIQEEIKKLYKKKDREPEDQFLKHIDDLVVSKLVSKLGIGLSSYITPKLINIESDKIICWINCKPSSKMVSLIEKSAEGKVKSKIVYRRSGSNSRPVTDPEEIIEFQNERFT